MGLLVALAACNASSPSAGVGSAPPSQEPPASSAGAFESPVPASTAWPGNVMEAVINVGLSDAQVQAASQELSTAAANEDLKALYRAADRLVHLLTDVQFEAERIQDYPATAAAAAAYAAALPDAIAGATRMRDSITSGDADGVAAGSEQLATGLAAYAEARRQIAPLVDQALLMQREILK